MMTVYVSLTPMLWLFHHEKYGKQNLRDPVVGSMVERCDLPLETH